jgi:carbon storage regulator
MLVLSRTPGESIVIADNITVTVIDVRGDKVRLGINAPASVAVHRFEVWKAIQDERKEDGSSGDNT